MTNTSDFRQYSYATDTSALLAGFDFSRGSYAPKIRPEESPADRMRVRGDKGIKSRDQLRAEQKASARLALRIVAVAAVCFLLIGLVINSLAVKNQLTREIARQEVAIANA